MCVENLNTFHICIEFGNRIGSQSGREGEVNLEIKIEMEEEIEMKVEAELFVMYQLFVIIRLN